MDASNKFLKDKNNSQSEIIQASIEIVYQYEIPIAYYIVSIVKIQNISFK